MSIRTIIYSSLLGALLVSPSCWAVPQQLQLAYQLLQQGVEVAQVSEQLTATDKQYHIRSITRGKGIYKLMGERTVTSDGLVVSGTLRPMHFEIQQSSHAHKTLVNDFDWAKKTLNMQIKGETEKAKLDKGSQDLLSVMYCWMWQMPKSKSVSLPITNGKKLSPHQFTLSEEEVPLQTPAGTFQVVKLADAEGGKTLYLAKDKDYLPVKIVVIDDGKRMEQVITSIHGQ